MTSNSKEVGQSRVLYFSLVNVRVSQVQFVLKFSIYKIQTLNDQNTDMNIRLGYVISPSIPQISIYFSLRWSEICCLKSLTISVSSLFGYYIVHHVGAALYTAILMIAVILITFISIISIRVWYPKMQYNYRYQSGLHSQLKVWNSPMMPLYTSVLTWNNFGNKYGQNVSAWFCPLIEKFTNYI